MTILVAQALTWMPLLRDTQVLRVMKLVTLVITCRWRWIRSQAVSGSQTQTTAFVDFADKTFGSATITARGALDI